MLYAFLKSKVCILTIKITWPLSGRERILQKITLYGKLPSYTAFQAHESRTVVFSKVEEEITMKSNIDNKEVGKRLQNFREIRGLTRAVLALRLDMSEKDLEDIEAGEKQLSPENIEVLRETFSVDPAWLLGGQTL